MRTILFILFLLLVAFVGVAREIAMTASERRDPGGRGQYLVDQVAMCIECHTPRDDYGQRLRTKYLDGAIVPVKPPPYPQMKWAIKAPAIAGLPGYTKEQGIRLLTEGITRDGRIPDPPMPRFRLTRSDAEAVVAYLKSLR